MLTLVKKTEQKLNITHLKNKALAKSHYALIKGGDDGIIVQDVIVH